MAESQPEPTVTRDTERQRYEIAVGGETAGFTAYVDQAGERIFFHTVIEEHFGGRGLASRLITQALADTRETGMRAVAVCPFVARYVQNHHDFDDIVDPATPAHQAVARAAMQE